MNITGHMLHPEPETTGIPTTTLPTSTTTIIRLSAFSNDLYYKNAFFRIICALLLRAGYLLIQLGSVPTENVYIILLQNIVDMTMSVLNYLLYGYTFAYGKDLIAGIIGYDLFIGSKYSDFDKAIYGLCAVIIGSAIITSLTSGRLHFFGYLISSCAYSGILVPLYIHWIWSKNGLFRKQKILSRTVSTKDYAGALVVHLSAGVSGSVGTMFLGRRVLRLYDIDESSIGTESPGTCTVGYLFVVIGLIAFSLPNMSYEEYIQIKHFKFGQTPTGLIMLNNVFAIFGSTFVVVLLSVIFFRKAFHYWIIQRCMQGMVVGLVSISAGANVFAPIVAFGIAAFAGGLFTLTSWLINLTFLEDYCNIISIHIITAIYSSLVTALFAKEEHLGYSISSATMAVHFLWQIISALGIAIVTFLAMCLLYGLFYILNCLRNKSEKINHLRAMNLKDNSKNLGFLERIFLINQETSFIEPGPYGKRTEQGEIVTKGEGNLLLVKSSVHQPPNKYRKFNQNEKMNLKKSIFTVQNAEIPEKFYFVNQQQSCGDQNKNIGKENDLRTFVSVHINPANEKEITLSENKELNEIQSSSSALISLPINKHVEETIFNLQAENKKRRSDSIDLTAGKKFCPNSNVQQKTESKIPLKITNTKQAINKKSTSLSNLDTKNYEDASKKNPNCDDENEDNLKILSMVDLYAKKRNLEIYRKYFLDNAAKKNAMNNEKEEENKNKFVSVDSFSTENNSDLRNFVSIDSHYYDKNKQQEKDDGYELHKTEKDTNITRKLKKTKTVRVFKPLSTNIVNKKTVVDYLPNEVDKKLNDGFVTIKPPMKK